GKQGDPKALHYLALCLDSEDSELRRTCIWSIGQIGLPEGVPLLRSRFADPDLMCQKWIAKSLGRILYQDSSDALLDYYHHLIQRGNLHNRVLNDILRAAASLASFSNKDDWEPIAISVLQNSGHPISHQAALKLLLSIGSCPFGHDVPEDIFSKLLHPLTKDLFYEMGWKCSIGDLLEMLWESSKDLKALTYLVALRYPNSSKRFLQMCNDLNYCLAIGRGLLLGNHLDPEFLNVIQNFQSNTLDYLQIRYEFLVRLKKDISIIYEMFTEPRLTTSAIRMLEYFGTLDESVKILSEYAVHGKKKHVQAVVSTIGAIFSKGTISDGLKDVLITILNHERVWHIRRDARLLLRFYSEKL
ncbi:MAG: HEAT repeat domain-containing protein, partial [Methanobacteriota archaeon]